MNSAHDAMPFTPRILSLLNDLHSGEPEKLDAAINKLKELYVNEGVRIIDQLSLVLHHIDPERRCDAIELLVIISPEKSIEKVLPLLNDPVDFVRNCVCQEIDFNDCDEPILIEPLINALLSDPVSDIRYWAAKLLGKIGDSKARKALEYAKENDKEVNFEGDKVSDRAAWAIEQLS